LLGKGAIGRLIEIESSKNDFRAAGRKRELAEQLQDARQKMLHIPALLVMMVTV
jgi:hypothetical protein